MVWDQNDRQAGLQRDRLAGHPHRPDRQRARRRRRPGPLPRQDRPAAGDLLLRPEGRVDPRQRRRRARERPRRRPAVRQHGHLVHLEPDRRHRRRRPRHRRDQRQPHDADGPRRPSTGTTRCCRAHGHPARRCCPRSARPARSTARRVGELAGVPIAGDLGDQQAATVRPDLLRRRRGQEHLRHRQLPAPQHRAPSRCQSKNGLLTTVGYKIGEQDAGLRPRGLDRDHRRARPVAARQPRA